MEMLWLLALLLVIAGVIGLVFPALPGIPLLYGGLLLAAWIDDFSLVGGWTIAVIGVIAVIAWLVDLVASVVTTQRAGASKQALYGTMIGGVVGIVGGVPGIILGTVVGAMLGELMARRGAGQATRVGIAAGLGFVLALAAKVLLGLLMLGMFVYAYFV